MSTPTDKEVKKATAEILQGCDIASTSLKAVRKQLEEKFNCSLADQKEVIYKAFEKFLAKNEAVIQYKEIVDAEIKQEEALAEAEAAEEEDYDLPAKKKSRGGFGAEVHLAPDLADFLGSEVMPRTEVTKRIWAYIKEHDLQDPSDGRLIVCDAALEKVLKRKTIHMFKMTKELSKMMMKPNEVNYGIEEEEDGDESADETTPNKRTKKEKDKATPKTKAAKKDSAKDKKADPKDKKRKASGMEDSGNDSKKLKKQSAYTISDKLQSLLGLTSDDTRYQVVAKMWEYIRGHDLQNPADKREVRLDKALQDIFKVKTFTIFSMNKHLSSQIVKN